MDLLVTDQNYADKINRQFYKSKSHYVSLEKRLLDAVNNDRYRKYTISASVEEFQNRNPQIQSWGDFNLCRSEKTTLDKILIDVTLQRMLDINHVCGITDKFQSLRVMPISVYEDPLAPGKYVCWDGQHTAIVLYLIAALVLRLDISKCEVPIVIYQSNLKAEMRQNFIELNGPAKLPLEDIDKYHQMIFGVRTDGSSDPLWLLAEQKQQALENAGIFATNTKFNDTDQPGALSRLKTELMDINNYDLSITQNFCKYFVKVCDSCRPVQPKEVWMLYEYFKLCKTEGIEVNDDYITGVSNSLKFDNNDFNSIKLVTRAKISYQNWWIANNMSIDNSLRGISYPEYRLGLTFLIKQIAKNFNGNVPVGNPLWIVPEQDLF